MANIKVFEDKKVRTVWDEAKEDWWFSAVDVVSILADSADYQAARKYWNKLMQRLRDEGSQLVTNCHRLKMVAQDGKLRETDVLDTQGVLRLVQSIPSPKAEPFKMWLAKVGADRLDEIADPEKAIMRGADFYRAKGYTEGWINQRLQTIEMRKELTDEWKARGIDSQKDYAILTNEMTKAWSGMSVQDMTNIELVLNMLAEVTSTTISRQESPQTFEQNKMVARRGGSVANDAKRRFEEETGQTVVSKLTAKNKNLLEIKRDAKSED